MPTAVQATPRMRTVPRLLQAGEGGDAAGALAELLSQLAAGLSSPFPLRRLAVNPDAYFTLPSGQLIAASTLLEPAAVAEAAAAGLDVRQWVGTQSRSWDTFSARRMLTPRQGA